MRVVDLSVRLLGYYLKYFRLLGNTFVVAQGSNFEAMILGNNENG